MKRMSLFAAIAAGSLLGLGGTAEAVVNTVRAGAGLTGGGSASTVTLNVAAGPGIRIVADKVRVGFVGSSCPDGKYLIGFTAAGGLNCSCLGGICATKGIGTDPAEGDVGTPDLTTVEVAVGNGNLTAKVLFVPGTFNKDLHYVSLNIDADRDPLTGTDWWGMGVEYVISGGGSCFIPGAQVYTTGVGADEAGNVTALANGYLFSVPMSALGNDDGVMDIIVTVQTQVTCATWSSIQDEYPDMGSGFLTLAP